MKNVEEVISRFPFFRVRIQGAPPRRSNPMGISLKSWLSHVMAFVLGVSAASGFALAAGNPHYIVTNDDVPPALATSVTFYTVGAGGLLTMKAKILIARGGIAGGYFAANR